MKNDEFKIYIDRLHSGDSEQIQIETSPSFIDVVEPELKFLDPVVIEGEAYLAEQDLILNLQISTLCRLPCSICNKEAVHEIAIPKFYFMKSLAEIPSHIFNFSEDVREAILLEVPYVVECSGGRCPERKEVEEFLAPPKDSEDDGWQPFKDL